MSVVAVIYLLSVMFFCGFIAGRGKTSVFYYLPTLVWPIPIFIGAWLAFKERKERK